MPTEVKHTIIVSIPSASDFAARFPQYGPRANGDGAEFFDLVMRPEVLINAGALTRCLKNVPAVTAVAESATRLAGGAISGTDKQFLGALICTLMEHNGFAKTGRKGSVPHPAWSKGEVYEPGR